MKFWIKEVLIADPHAIDEWLNRATMVVVILALGSTLLGRWKAGGPDPQAWPLAPAERVMDSPGERSLHHADPANTP